MNMEKHTYSLKDTIEYKKCFKEFKIFLCIPLISFFVILGVIIHLFFSLPIEYALLCVVIVIVAYFLSFWIFIYLLIKSSKEIRNLIKHYDEYMEMEIYLSIPITVRGSAVKYVIKVKEENGFEKQIESHIYNEALITSKKMLIGYNPSTDDVIFLKNI